MIRYYYPGTDVGALTLYQLSEMMQDLAEIKKMESGASAKDPEHMTAQEKIEMYRQKGMVS